jgi:hypothetical protein
MPNTLYMEVAMSTQDCGANTQMQDVQAGQTTREQSKAPKNGGQGDESAITSAAATSETSARKIVANRRNAQKSNGPRTVEGKRRSSLNAMTDGVLARHAVITVGDGKEDQIEFDELHQKLREHYQPDGIQDELDIEELALTYWRKARAARAEVGAVRGPLDTLQQNETQSRIRSLGTEKMFADFLPTSADTLLSSSACRASAGNGEGVRPLR